MACNVRGLKNPIHKYSVQSELERVSSQYNKIDFLYLQYVKIFDFNLECACSFMCLGSSFYATNHFRGKGGAFTIMPPKWMSLLVSLGVDP